MRRSATCVQTSDDRRPARSVGDHDQRNETVQRLGRRSGRVIGRDRDGDCGLDRVSCVAQDRAQQAYHIRCLARHAVGPMTAGAMKLGCSLSDKNRLTGMRCAIRGVDGRQTAAYTARTNPVAQPMRGGVERLYGEQQRQHPNQPAAGRAALWLTQRFDDVAHQNSIDTGLLQRRRKTPRLIPASPIDCILNLQRDRACAIGDQRLSADELHLTESTERRCPKCQEQSARNRVNGAVYAWASRTQWAYKRSTSPEPSSRRD